MKRRWGMLCVFVAAVFAQPPAAQAKAPSYLIRTIEGWTVHINVALLGKEGVLTEKALELLRKQLEEIVRVVPPKAVGKLREVQLWFSPEYSGVKQKAEYHPGTEWLREHHRDPAMVKGVELPMCRSLKRR